MSGRRPMGPSASPLLSLSNTDDLARADRACVVACDDPTSYDQQIARNLQEEEDARAARHLVQRDQERADGRSRRTADRSRPAATAVTGGSSADGKKKKKGCVVM